VEEYIREIRQAVWNLRAPILETHDLAGALREVGKRATSGTTIRFDLIARGRTRQSPPEVENEILRIGQEAITNAVRHANASRVQAELRFERQTLALRVWDDGRGLDVAYRTSNIAGHFGLIGMRERAAQLGGQLHIAKTATGGTEVELIVPAVFQPVEA
jgi:signal transduction histidine kinase